MHVPSAGRLRASVPSTNGTSLSVSHFVTDAYASESDRAYRPAPRGLGLFRPLQRLRPRWAAKDEVASDAELIVPIEFTPYASAIRVSDRRAQAHSRNGIG